MFMHPSVLRLGHYTPGPAGGPWVSCDLAPDGPNAYTWVAVDGQGGVVVDSLTPTQAVARLEELDAQGYAQAGTHLPSTRAETSRQMTAEADADQLNVLRGRGSRKGEGTARVQQGRTAPSRWANEEGQTLWEGEVKRAVGDGAVGDGAPGDEGREADDASGTPQDRRTDAGMDDLLRRLQASVEEAVGPEANTPPAAPTSTAETATTVEADAVSTADADPGPPAAPAPERVPDARTPLGGLRQRLGHQQGDVASQAAVGPALEEDAPVVPVAPPPAPGSFLARLAAIKAQRDAQAGEGSDATPDAPGARPVR